MLSIAFVLLALAPPPAGTSAQTLASSELTRSQIMSTPAISDGVIVVRTLGHDCGIGQK